MKTSTTSRKLMAVDDDFDITFTLKRNLERRGFSLDVYNDPTEALTNFKPDYYDLLLLDVKMPKMNGFELYREINKIDRNVKVCFFTAYEAFYYTLRKQFPNLNTGWQIGKPINISDLVIKINEVKLREVLLNQLGFDSINNIFYLKNVKTDKYNKSPS